MLKIEKTFYPDANAVKTAIKADISKEIYNPFAGYDSEDYVRKRAKDAINSPKVLEHWIPESSISSICLMEIPYSKQKFIRIVDKFGSTYDTPGDSVQEFLLKHVIDGM